MVGPNTDECNLLTSGRLKVAATSLIKQTPKIEEKLLVSDLLRRGKKDAGTWWLFNVYSMRNVSYYHIAES